MSFEYNVDPEKNYRPDEVADILRVDTKTVYRYLNDIEDPLPCVKLGSKTRGCLRISGVKLKDWLSKREVETWR